jgi:hypothetical protein
MKEERIDGEDEEASGEESCEIQNQEVAKEIAEEAGEETDCDEAQACSQEDKWCSPPSA